MYVALRIGSKETKSFLGFATVVSKFPLFVDKAIFYMILILDYNFKDLIKKKR